MDQQAAGSQASRPRSCTEECKRQVVDLLVSTGRTALSMAAEVGIRRTLLSRWLRQHKPPAGSDATAAATLPPRPAAACLLKPVPAPRADQAAEIARLRRETERLRMERDILEKGIAIFAVPSR